MITFIIVLYFLCYFIVFFIKTIRDYIVEYEKSNPDRWNDWVFKDKLPEWIQAYLLSEDILFKSSAPKWALKLFWDDKEDKLKVAVDGRHQLDGIIFLLPHTVLVLAICLLAHLAWYWIILWIGVVPFLFWYQYFNLNYHICQQKKNKQWFRIPCWIRILFGKK